MAERAPGRLGPVLVGVGDDHGHAALRWAAGEAVRRGVPLQLVHTYSADASYPWGYGYPLPASVLINAEEVARSNALGVLEDAANVARDTYPGLQVTATLARSSAAAALVAASADASVLVVGRRTRKHPRLAALGSVSLAVAAHAACPVVVVPHAADAETTPETTPGTASSTALGTPLGPAIGQIVVGVEESAECADAVGFAFAQADACGLPLTAVHAWWVDPAVLALSEGAVWSELPIEEPAEEPGVVDELLAPWVSRYPDVRLRRVAAREMPADALLAVAEGAELLVVGSRGRGGFAELLLGSVSRDVLQHATCPVAVVRAGQLLGANQPTRS
jgi:nucleotide-binding universal stress UspA family protein